MPQGPLRHRRVQLRHERRSSPPMRSADCEIRLGADGWLPAPIGQAWPQVEAGRAFQGCVDCGLLFCEAHDIDFYAKLGGTHSTARYCPRQVLVPQSQGRLAFDRLHALACRGDRS